MGAFGGYLFTKRQPLLRKWHYQLTENPIVRDHTFSHGLVVQVYEDLAVSVLSSLSLLTTHWDQLGLPQDQFIKSLVGLGEKGKGVSLFDILAIGFGPAYIGEFGTYFHFNQPLEVTPDGTVKLTSDALSRIRLSKQIWNNLDPAEQTDFETGRGCPMAVCLKPGESTQLTQFVIEIFKRAELL